MALLQLQLYVGCVAADPEGGADAGAEVLEGALIAGFGFTDVTQGSAKAWALLALIFANGEGQGCRRERIRLCYQS